MAAAKRCSAEQIVARLREATGRGNVPPTLTPHVVLTEVDGGYTATELRCASVP